MNNLLSRFFFLTCTLLLSGCKKEFKELHQPNFPAYGETQNILATENVMGDSVNITPYIEIFTGNANSANARDSTYQQHTVWKKCGESISPGFFNEKGITWFRLTLQNTRQDAFKRLLCLPKFTVITGMSKKFPYFVIACLADCCIIY